MRRLVGTAAILLVLVASAFAQQVHYVSGFTISPVTGCIWVVQPSSSPPDRKLCNPNFLSAIGLMQVSANTMDGNWLSGSAVDRHNAIASCADGQGWLVYVTSTGISCGGIAASDVVTSTPQNISTTSTSAVMGGLDQQAAGFQIFMNPKASGNYLVTVSGTAFSTLAADGVTAQLRWGTGTAPANGDAVTGTTIGKAKAITNISNGSRYPMRLQAYATSVSGCPCWIDISIQANTGGTATLSALSAIAMER